MKRPLIGVPIGDPAGIGPEIAVKLLRDHDIYKTAEPVLIGNKPVISRAMRFCKLNTAIRVISSPSEGVYNQDTVNLINVDNIGACRIGEVQAECGRAAYEYIALGTRLALKGDLGAIATAPINKESLKAAGIPYVGHTEMLAELTKTKSPLMMFEVKGMRVFFMTRHISLADAVASVTEDRVLRYIRLCSEALIRIGAGEGVLAVAGLNPHCGENGLFGDEELVHIIPAVNKAKQMGIRVDGPFPADSVFYRALKGHFSGVLSLYHDQGHIATKSIDFERTVAVTLGLPFIRTSVDHGTAFDIAGTGRASETSLIEAVRTAAEYAPVYSSSINREKR
jgi:4-hydroxythreonine-4-phosphate dehydrogenase